MQDSLSMPPCALAAVVVDQPPPGDRRQPRPRIVGRVLRPDAQGLDQRLLQCVLGGVEVLAAPHEAGQDARDEGAQCALLFGEGKRDAACDGLLDGRQRIPPGNVD